LAAEEIPIDLHLRKVEIEDWFMKGEVGCC